MPHKYRETPEGEEVIIVNNLKIVHFGILIFNISGLSFRCSDLYPLNLGDEFT